MYAKKYVVKIIDVVIIVMSIATLTVVLFTGCNDRVKATVTYTVNEPVYMPYAAFRTPPPVQPAQKMVNPGKICLYGSYLFINEITKGFHIIDNRNPAAPQNIGFVELLGNIDITVNGNLLYADSYIDLVWLDITNPAQPTAAGRLEKVFPNVLPPTNNDYLIGTIDNTKGVVVGWEVKTITEEEDLHYYHPCWDCVYYGLASADKGGSWENAGGTSNVTTMTGSMARFAVYGGYLYVVNSNVLKVFPLSGNSATAGNEQYLSWNVETIFAYNQHLFMGTTNGLLIYDLANPAAPTRVSSYSHVVGCDPVVVQGNYAYVTIRGGNTCGQNLSLLEIIDIANLQAPALKASYTMASPYGLGIDGTTLFVCDEGLKVFDATNPIVAGTKLIKHFSGINGFDVIPYNNVLILIGSDGLYQYDYSNLQNIKQVSVLK